MSALLIGYARVSTDEQDLTAQRPLQTLGVGPSRIYVVMVSPAPTGTVQVCARRWLPAGTGTPSSSRSSTGSPAHFRMPEPFLKNSRRVG